MKPTFERMIQKIFYFLSFPPILLKNKKSSFCKNCSKKKNQKVDFLGRGVLGKECLHKMIEKDI